MSYLSDARISLNNVNRHLENMGYKRRIGITKSYGTRRLSYDDNHEVVRRSFTPKELDLALEVLDEVLMYLDYHKEEADA